MGHQPKQAEIVRYIFERYVCGVSATAIAKELNAMGKKTVRGQHLEGRRSAVYPPK